MRPHSTFTFLIFFILTACAGIGQESPEVVLQKAMHAGRKMHAMRLSGEGSFHNVSTSFAGIRSGSIRLDGEIQQAGRQLRVNVDLSEETERNMAGLRANADILVLDGGETYLRLNMLTAADSSPFSSAQQSMLETEHIWWQLSAPRDDTMGSISPDPHWLRMHADAIQVTHDFGIVRIAGTETYHYDVRLNPEKMREILGGTGVTSDSMPEASGSLWIDAHDYSVRRMKWDMLSSHGGAGSFTLSFEPLTQPTMLTPPENVRTLPQDHAALLHLPAPL